MAITLADFTKIWASTSPLTPYSFSESNYKEGWNFIGGTPPSRQMWDSVQNQNDEKLKYIVDNFLPLSGGTMTGDIEFYDDLFIGTPADSVDPSQKSSFSGLYSKKNDPHNYGGIGFVNELTGETRPQFNISAGDGTHRAFLVGYGDDDPYLTFKAIPISVSAVGSNYIRYDNGLQICWGSLDIPSGTEGRTVSGTMTFPYPFANANYVLTFGNNWCASSNEYYRAEGTNTTHFKFTAAGVGSNGHSAFYIAIGYWK